MDKDHSPLNYIWWSSGGVITGGGTWISWQAPAASGNYIISCKVQDEHGSTDSTSITIQVVEYINIPPVIDDLKGNNNERYSRKVLKEVKIEHEKCLLFIFDYRAAVYCNSADFYLIKDILEDKRLKNLKKRSMRSYKRYRGFFYRYPPIPFRVDPSKVYIWKDDSIELFKG